MGVFVDKTASFCFSLLAAICCSVIFGKYAIALLYCFIVIFTLSKPWLVRIYDLFIASVVFDIYSGNLVGVSFLQCLALYVIIVRFRSILLNTRVSYGIFCFGFILFVPELICAFFASISGGSFVLLNHLKIIAAATVLFSIYCSATIVHRKISDV